MNQLRRAPYGELRNPGWPCQIERSPSEGFLIASQIICECLRWHRISWELSGEVPITFLCRNFEVSTNGYYKALRFLRSPASPKKSLIVEGINRIYKKRKGSSGSPRFSQELMKSGVSVSENTVEKYMKKIGLDAR